MGYWSGSGVNLTEREETRECSQCEQETEVTVYYEDEETWWECPNCKHTHHN